MSQIDYASALDFVYKDQLYLFVQGENSELEVVTQGSATPFMDTRFVHASKWVSISIGYMASLGDEYLILRLEFGSRPGSNVLLPPPGGGIHMGNQNTYLVPKCDPRLSKSRALGIEGAILVGSEHILYWVNVEGCHQLRLASGSDFLEKAMELPDCAHLDPTANNTLCIPFAVVEPRCNVSYWAPVFVDIGDARFLGLGLVSTFFDTFAFVKPDGWSGDIGEIEIKRFGGGHLQSVANAPLDHRTIGNYVGVHPDSSSIRVGCLREDMAEDGIRRGRIEEQYQYILGPALMNVKYFGRLKYREGGYYRVLSGSIRKGDERMWVYDYLNDKIADLNVPIGKWVSYSDTLMKRLEGPETIDVSRLPQLQPFEAYLSPEDKEDLSFKEYKSACTDTAMVKCTGERRDDRGEFLMEWVSSVHPNNERVLRSNGIWKMSMKGMTEDVGRFRVIAGMGPVPMKLRSKNFKEIEVEGFADYLGGPIFFNTNRDYPTQFFRFGSIPDFHYMRRSSKLINVEFTEFGHPRGAQVISGDPTHPSHPVWAGVVDIEMEEPPLEYLSMEEASTYDAPLTDGKPYFEVWSSSLLVADASSGSEDYRRNLIVKNVANGKWFFKMAKNAEGMSQLIAWHESVDGELEFQEPSQLSSTDYSMMHERVRSYDDQEDRRVEYMYFVNRFLEYVGVPKDVGKYILDYVLLNPDSESFWGNRIHPDGWILHNTGLELVGSLVGIFDSMISKSHTQGKYRRTLPIPKDVLVADPLFMPWETLLENIPHDTPSPLPGGCVYKPTIQDDDNSSSEDWYCDDKKRGGAYPVEFKSKEGTIRAARIVMDCRRPDLDYEGMLDSENWDSEDPENCDYSEDGDSDGVAYDDPWGGEDSMDGSGSDDFGF